MWRGTNADIEQSPDAEHHESDNDDIAVGGSLTYYQVALPNELVEYLVNLHEIRDLDEADVEIVESGVELSLKAINALKDIDVDDDGAAEYNTDIYPHIDYVIWISGFPHPAVKI